MHLLPRPPTCVRQRLRAAAVLNIEDSHRGGGHLAGVQGPSLSSPYADLYCLLHIQSACVMFTVLNRLLKCNR